MSQADLVIEAIVENIDVKRKLFAEVEKAAKRWGGGEKHRCPCLTPEGSQLGGMHRRVHSLGTYGGKRREILRVPPFQLCHPHNQHFLPSTERHRTQSQEQVEVLSVYIFGCCCFLKKHFANILLKDDFERLTLIIVGLNSAAFTSSIPSRWWNCSRWGVR